MTNLTRTDCTRDNKAVICPNASTLGFSRKTCKRGCWIMYEEGGLHHVGRVIGRVICENNVYVEVAVATADFSAALIQWVEPAYIRECRPAPPRAVFAFFAEPAWEPRLHIFPQLEHGVSDMHDQLRADALPDKKPPADSVTRDQRTASAKADDAKKTWEIDRA